MQLDVLLPFLQSVECVYLWGRFRGSFLELWLGFISAPRYADQCLPLSSRHKLGVGRLFTQSRTHH